MSGYHKYDAYAFYKINGSISLLAYRACCRSCHVLDQRF